MRTFATACLLLASVFTAYASPLSDAIADPGRPKDDVAQDANRQPQAILEFAGIQPGMTVADLNSGGGYVTELLSRTVGANGRVYAWNDKLYWPFAQKDLTARLAGNRLPNVVEVHGTSEAVTLPEGSLDAAVMVMAYHDYYFITKDTQPQAADPMKALAGIRKALKTGGVLVIVDHVAAAGSPPEVGNSLHRIDPALVKSQVEAAGFSFVGESDALHRAADNHSLMVFDPAIRGKTDQFIYKFVK